MEINPESRDAPRNRSLLIQEISVMDNALDRRAGSLAQSTIREQSTCTSDGYQEARYASAQIPFSSRFYRQVEVDNGRNFSVFDSA